MTALGTSNEVQVTLFPVTVALSNPQIQSIGPNPDDILKQGEGFQLLLDVSFSGAGAAALMALGIPVRVSWFAESYGVGPEKDLGSQTITTSLGVFNYTVVLNVPANPLTAEYIYKLAAALRVGSPAAPAIANGFIEAGAIEIYNP